MKKVLFIADGHSYWLDDQDGDVRKVLEIPSVGRVFKRFFPDFDENYWLTHGALKEIATNQLSDLRKNNFPKQIKPNPYELFPPLLESVDHAEFLDSRHRLANSWKWKKVNSQFRGTKFHEMLEKKAEKQGFLINPFTEKEFTLRKHDPYYDNESRCENLFDLEEGVYTELLIFDLDLWIAGQVDECFIKNYGKRRFVWINDHKTNEEKPSKSSPENMLEPFSHYYASKHMGYCFQLSTYAYILEKAGFTIKNLGYTWYKNYNPEQKELIEVEYLKEDCQTMLNFGR